MDRDTQRGQMIIEMLILIFLFTGLFLVAIGISENGDHEQSKFRFSKNESHFSKGFKR